MVAAGNALRQLAQVVAREQFPQLGLTDQDDLQQLLLRRLEVRQQADLLEHVGREILCFVDDENRSPAVGMSVQQVTVQGVNKHLDARRVLRYRDLQFFADRLQKLESRQLRIQYDRNVGIFRHAVQQ